MTDRRTASVGVNVDIANLVVSRQTAGVGVDADIRNLAVDRQTAALGVTVDLAVGAGTVTYPLTVTASQAQVATPSYLVCVPRQYGQLETQTYAQLEALTYAELETVCSAVIPPVLVATTQTQSVRLGQAVSLRRTVGQGQSLSLAMRRVLSWTLTTAQAQAVRLVKTLGFVRSVAVHDSLTLASAMTRTLATNQSTSVRLLQQVRLARSLSQPQAATFGGLPVQLRVVSVVQTRSLALLRDVFLIRAIARAQALVLKSDQLLIRTLQSSTLASLVRDTALRRTVSQPTQAALGWQPINPRYQVLVTTQVSQHVALAQATTGKPSRVFTVASCRTIVFPTCQRGAHFQAPRRGVTFTAEVR